MKQKQFSYLWVVGIVWAFTGLKEFSKIFINPQHVVPKNRHPCWRWVATSISDNPSLCSIYGHPGDHIKNIICPVEEVSSVINC